MKKICSLANALLFLLVTASYIQAVPHTLSYQGYLTDTNGTPRDGQTNITFKLYDVDTGGTYLWSSGQLAINITNGTYSVILGDTSPPTPQPAINPAIFPNQLWLGIEIESDGEMVPRKKLTSVSYSIKAESADTAIDADTVDGQHATDLASDARVTALEATVASLESIINSLDTSAPQSSITTPAANSEYGLGELIDISVDVQDNVALTEVRLQVRGALDYDNFVLVPPDTTTYTANLQIQVPNNTPYGTATLTPAATDTSGNTTAGSPIDILINPYPIFIQDGSWGFIAGGTNDPLLNGAEGIDIDGQGNLYIAGSNASKIIKVNIATGNASAFSGILPPNGPVDVAYEGITGGVYTTISSADEILYIDTDQTMLNWDSMTFISSIAGMALDESANILYVLDRGSDSILTYDTAQGAGATPNIISSPVIDARDIYKMTSLLTTDEVLYITDRSSHTVWEYDITTASWRDIGTSLPVFSQPYGIVGLSNGDVLISDYSSGELWQIMTSSCAVLPCTTKLIGSGFNSPAGLTIDPASTSTNAIVYATDTILDAVFKVVFDPTAP